MMKTILLLAFAVLVSSSPVKPSDKTLLGDLIDELDKAVKSFAKETEGTPRFLAELQMNGSKHEFFCQAEKELEKEVSGLSGAKFEHFRIDKKLMRNLIMYNKHHGKTCKPANKGQDQIPLQDFLKNLLTCVRSEFSKIKPN